MSEYNLTLEEAKAAMKAGYGVRNIVSSLDYLYSKSQDDFYFITHELMPCFYMKEEFTDNWKVSLTAKDAEQLKVRTFKNLNRNLMDFYLEDGVDDETNGDQKQ